MSFLDGTLVESASRLWLEVPRTRHAPRDAPPHAECEEYAGRIAIPAWAAVPLAGRKGQPLCLGVRPEDLLPLADGSRPTAALAANIQQIERLGDRTHVYLSTGGQRLGGKLDARSPAAVGTAVQVHVDLDRVHFFAPDDPTAGRWGENLCLTSEPDV